LRNQKYVIETEPHNLSPFRSITLEGLFTHIILRNSTDFIKYKYTIFKNDFWSIGNQLLV